MGTWKMALGLPAKGLKSLRDSEVLAEVLMGLRVHEPMGSLTKAQREFQVGQFRDNHSVAPVDSPWVPAGCLTIKVGLLQCHLLHLPSHCNLQRGRTETGREECFWCCN